MATRRAGEASAGSLTPNGDPRVEGGNHESPPQSLSLLISKTRRVCSNLGLVKGPWHSCQVALSCCWARMVRKSPALGPGEAIKSRALSFRGGASGWTKRAAETGINPPSVKLRSGNMANDELKCSRIVPAQICAPDAEAAHAARPETLPRVRKGKGRSQRLVRTAMLLRPRDEAW